MNTRTVTVRGIPDATLERLRAMAEANRRSLNGELLTILDRAAAGPTAPAGMTPAGTPAPFAAPPGTPAPFAAPPGTPAPFAAPPGTPAPFAAPPGTAAPFAAPAATPAPFAAPGTPASDAAESPYVAASAERDSSLLADVDRAALAAICRRHDIEWLAVFGSHARGEARPDSDVDVVVDFAAGRTPGFGIVRVADALRVVFGGRRVDLVTRRGLSSRMRKRVLDSARTLHGER